MGYLKSFSKTIKKKKKSSPKEAGTTNYLLQLINLIDEQVDGLSNVVEIMQAKYTTELVPPIFENYLFFRLVYKDILTLIDQLLKVENDREKNLIARSLALHLYEFLDDSQDFLGPKMKGGLIGFEELKEFDKLQKDLYKLKEIARAVKNKAFKELGEIRNSTSAHKEQNSLLLKKKIAELNVKDVNIRAVLCTAFFMCIMQFQNNVLQAITSDMPEHSLTEKLPFQPYKSVDQTFRQFSMIIQGVDPQLAEILSRLTNEEIDHLRIHLEESEKKSLTDMEKTGSKRTWISNFFVKFSRKQKL
jgi:hypothetical protein